MTKSYCPSLSKTDFNSVHIGAIDDASNRVSDKSTGGSNVNGLSPIKSLGSFSSTPLGLTIIVRALPSLPIKRPSSKITLSLGDADCFFSASRYIIFGQNCDRKNLPCPIRIQDPPSCDSLGRTPDQSTTRLYFYGAGFPVVSVPLSSILQPKTNEDVGQLVWWLESYYFGCGVGRTIQLRFAATKLGSVVCNRCKFSFGNFCNNCRFCCLDCRASLGL